MTTKSAASLLVVAAAFLLLLLLPTESIKLHSKQIILTNNHTNYLSVRCFSFDDAFNVVHLAPWEQFKFQVKKRALYPSSIMFNCSTNVGTFVAFKYNYECIKDQYETCDWRFDEDAAYRWDPKWNVWGGVDYAPNYESLNRGGVVKGYFAN